MTMSPLLRRALPLFATASLVMPAQAGLNLGTLPLYLGASVQPIVMLNLPRDHQLYVKAYNDYSDLDNDGVNETTYKHSVNYFGYFDSFKCYERATGPGRWTPTSTTTTKTCAGTEEWSGDWLNYMKRWISWRRL